MYCLPDWRASWGPLIKRFAGVLVWDELMECS